MTSPGEQKALDLAGVSGAPPPLRRAPKAWDGMLRAFFVGVPTELARSQRNRRALLRRKR